MLDLESTIKHCEEMAEKNEEMCRVEELMGLGLQNTEMMKCARTYKQLAEWLTDYKRSLEQEQVLDKIKDEIMDTLYVDSLIFGELIDFKNGKISADDVIEEFNRVTRMEVLRIIDKYRIESEK